MARKINISHLTMKAKDEYFAALLSLENHVCISSLKKDLLNKENDYQFLINKVKILSRMVRLYFVILAMQIQPF